MSETQEGYGAQSTPDMGESYPPQTGDLLGSYIARLSARVRELEGTLARFLTAVENANSYQADYGHRIVKLEESRKLGETPIENIDQLTVIINNWCSDLREWTGVVVRLEARVRELEAASIEPSAYQRSLEARIERLEQAAQPEPTAEPAVTTPAVCATCGHGKGYHQHVMSPGTWCDSGTLGKPCHCREFKPVTTPTVTRERTHGRYGTRNLTKSKPDHIVDANKKVCATCGHDKISHTRGYVPGVTEPVVSWCHSGTLGKPCKCTAFKPVASEG